MKTLRFLFLFVSLSALPGALLQAEYCISQTIRENILSSGRKDVLAVWDALEASGGGLEWSPATPAQREACVCLQACIERALVSGMQSGHLLAIGVIHTPLPPAPLRAVVGEGSTPEGLALSRPKILRDFLSAEGCLVAAYSKLALRRELDGMGIFELLQHLYPNLINNPCFGSLDPSWVGASYLISKLPEGQCFFFSIKTQQTHNTAEGMPLGVWFGPLSSPQVAERYYAVTRFLDPAGIDLQALLNNQLTWGIASGGQGTRPLEPVNSVF